MNIYTDYVTEAQQDTAISRQVEFILANGILGYTREDLMFTLSEPGINKLDELNDIIRHGMDFPDTEGDDWS